MVNVSKHSRRPALVVTVLQSAVRSASALAISASKAIVLAVKTQSPAEAA